MRAGATEAKIAEVATALASDLFDEREKAALAYAEAMTFTDRKVGEDVFARVRAHFSEAQIVELTAAVALENFRSKFNVALGIEAQGFCLIKAHQQRRTAGSGAGADRTSAPPPHDALRLGPTVARGREPARPHPARQPPGT